MAETDRETALIERHIGLVKHIASRMGRDLPAWEHEDLESYGYEGLIDAVRRFDWDSYDPDMVTPSGKNTFDGYFESFARPRIQGAILDGLRKQDWAPRSVRSALREIHRAKDDLRAELCREPSISELAAHLGVEEESVRTALVDQHSYTVSLDSGLRQDAGEEIGAIQVAHPPSDTAGEVELTHLNSLLAEALGRLPAELQEVAWLKYVEGLNLPEIGARIGSSRQHAQTLYVEVCMRVREHLAILA